MGYHHQETSSYDAIIQSLFKANNINRVNGQDRGPTIPSPTTRGEKENHSSSLGSTVEVKGWSLSLA